MRSLWRQTTADNTILIHVYNIPHTTAYYKLPQIIAYYRGLTLTIACNGTLPQTTADYHRQRHTTVDYAYQYRLLQTTNATVDYSTLLPTSPFYRGLRQTIAHYVKRPQTTVDYYREPHTTASTATADYCRLINTTTDCRGLPETTIFYRRQPQLPHATTDQGKLSHTNKR